MEITKTRKVILTFSILIASIGGIIFFILPVDTSTLVGLTAGACSATINYLILYPMVKNFMTEGYWTTFSLYALRVLIYLVAIFISLRFGSEAMIGFSLAIISISLSIFIVYGVGGLKKND